MSRPFRISSDDLSYSNRTLLHPALLLVILYSLLLRSFLLDWVTPVTLTNFHQEKQVPAPHKISFQYTSAKHVLGFGAGQVVVGHPTHALTMTLVKAKPVEPVIICEHHPGPSLSRHPGESRGPEELPASMDTGFCRYDGQTQPLPVPGPSARPFTGSVRYNNPWPGVSVIYRAQAGAILKSEYRLAPGFSAKTINQIRIRYNRPIRLDAQGHLVIRYLDGEMIESHPIAWQEIFGKKVPVEAVFIQRGEQEVGLAARGYDAGYELIIDPTILWNTFAGSGFSTNEYGLAITTDIDSNVYVVGSTDSLSQGMALKFNPFGELEWKQYLNHDSCANAIAIDNTGNLYIGGELGLIRKACVWKFNNLGASIWSYTYGANSSSVDSIAADDNGNVYIAGKGLATWGTPIRPYTSLLDAMVAKLDSNGTLIWNTFLGDTGDDTGTSVVLDGVGNVFVGGESNARWGSPVRNYKKGFDAFISKLDNNGNLLWNTFLGSMGDDFSRGIAKDVSGNIFLVGSSDSSWESPIRNYSSGFDAFIAKVDTNGNLLWNTFLGDTGYDEGRRIALDGVGNIYLSGNSDATWGTPFRVFTGNGDAFTAKLDSAGHLLWNGFLGAGGADVECGLAVDASGDIYAAGYSDSTWGNPVEVYSSANDIFAAKISDLDLTATSTGTRTATISPTRTYTSSATRTPTPTASPSQTMSDTFTITPSATPSSTPSPLFSPTVSPTTIPTSSASPTLTISLTLTPSRTITVTRTRTPSLTATMTLTQTPVLSATPPPTLTSTPNPALFTATPTLISPGQFFVHLVSHLIRVSRGDFLSFSLSLCQPGQVKLQLHDLSGRRVMYIMDSQQPAGTQLITRDLSALGSGTYILLAEANGQRARFKLVVLH